MHPAIAQYRTSIAAICQRYRIRRLEVFGSAARGDDFVPESSDADFLVEPGAVHNPYVLAGINRHREPVYAA